jgi:hypothetical protein
MFRPYLYHFGTDFTNRHRFKKVVPIINSAFPLPPTLFYYVVLPNMSKPNKSKHPHGIDYGLDYMGKTPIDPMDAIIAAALHGTMEEHAHSNGKEYGGGNDRIQIADAGAGVRTFMPVDPNVLAVTFDIDDEDDDVNDSDKKKAANPNEGMRDDKEDDEVNECKHCLQTPCYLDQKDESLDTQKELFDYLMDRGESMMDSGLKNNEIRYELYRIASCFCHGYLGKGNRQELPVCVIGEIKDAFPAQGGNYTGFKKGFLK